MKFSYEYFIQDNLKESHSKYRRNWLHGADKNNERTNKETQWLENYKSNQIGIRKLENKWVKKNPETKKNNQNKIYRRITHPITKNLILWENTTQPLEASLKPKYLTVRKIFRSVKIHITYCFLQFSASLYPTKDLTKNVIFFFSKYMLLIVRQEARKIMGIYIKKIIRF